ncbi:DUF3427 domain-containing protein [Agromyces mangrovi Wang et al. 2018]|uniref:DUF3427 domain-containing protein n=1 Tax=Agromyces mangrovi TaxID=1858653 RepID=UPI002573C3A6|nr:DUF3427 domain-containing protein [Agromyces mangrovi]BDZ64118.1 helicase [Agromyces mangrovi]
MLDGLYESPLTVRLRQALNELSDQRHDLSHVDEADQPAFLAQHILQAAEHALSGARSTEDRVRITNAVLNALGRDEEMIDSGMQRLDFITHSAAPGVIEYSARRPSIPLAETALLTNARDEPQLGHELRAELESADHVDLLCAFVKWPGLRILEDPLERLKDRGAPLRVVTTTYIGATDPFALRALVERYDAQIKVQYDIRRTRLHAKAWLFRRDSTFDTAYVGSSNLSRAALLDGLEWNVRLSRIATPSLITKFRATFDTYWSDATFEEYVPDRDEERLRDALAEASGTKSTDRVTISLSGLDVRPYPHQSEMLESLAAERQTHDRHRNLIIAATGTGKTVVAALDYKRLVAEAGADLRLLFVAHRGEILRQSLRTYREVLADASFGEEFHGGARPTQWKHVFASVQSLSHYAIEQVPADAFDVVVIDEFHHAEAPTYRRLIDHLRPTELLGLTATPERSDGIDVRSFFEGRSASELRLWDALKADLLVPFHYFGIADDTDLSRLEWKRGSYDTSALSALYTGNDARARIVLRQVRDKIGDVGEMRALGFCVSVEHARYMTQVFNEAGIPSVTVTGDTPRGERRAAVRDLEQGDVNAIFTVDVFNEGVDIPQVDTVLFLRPTESATIFIQQLGRGLRHHPSKAVLTALDFVGHQRTEFRFDRRFRALTGVSRGALKREVEQQFPFLPAGSQIMLDRVSRRIVLDSIRRQLSLNARELASDARLTGVTSLREFLAAQDLELSDLLRSSGKPRTWTTIKRDAGLEVPNPGPNETPLLKRVRALAHVDDPERAEAYLRILRDPANVPSDPLQRRFAEMLFYSLWPTGGGWNSIDEGLASLNQEPAVAAELAEVIELAQDASRHVVNIPSEMEGTPLRTHAQYQREEVLSALSWASLAKPPSQFREGVLWSERWKSDAFFVTLKKSEADYSPSTLYRDYAISPSLFHWESQSTTSESSPTGQRYISHAARGSTVLLFVREAGKNDLGTSPYTFLGPAKYVSHEGERPISFTWRLDSPMPTDLYLAASAVAA